MAVRGWSANRKPCGSFRIVRDSTKIQRLGYLLFALLNCSHMLAEPSKSPEQTLKQPLQSAQHQMILSLADCDSVLWASSLYSLILLTGNVAVGRAGGAQSFFLLAPVSSWFGAGCQIRRSAISATCARKAGSPVWPSGFSLASPSSS